MTQLDGHAVLLWGAFATGLLTLVLSGCQGLGWTRISLPYLIGTLFTARRGLAMVVGSAVHFGLGWVFAAVYALVFQAWGRAGVGVGALLGLYHGALVLVVGMQILPAVHPRMASRYRGVTPTRQLEPPGFLALHYGTGTPLVTLAAHVLYGAALGLLFRVG